MVKVIGSTVTPRLKAQGQKLVATLQNEAMLRIQDVLKREQQIVVAEAPVFEDAGGKAMPPPIWPDYVPAVVLGMPYPTGDPWLQTVVRTISQQLGGAIDWPQPGVLRNALSVPPGKAVEPHVVVAGFASHQALNDATRYQGRLLLALGRNPKPHRKPRRRGQLIWFDKDKGEWTTWSVLGRPDGTISLIGDRAGKSFNPRWRGNIQPGEGYWADVEFGTQDRQWNQLQGGDLAGDDLLYVALTRTGYDSWKAPSDPRIRGIGGNLSLTRAGGRVADELLRGAGAATFQREVLNAVRLALEEP